MQRAWRYHSEHEPKICEGEAAIAAAEADGWQDSPAKCIGFLDKIGVDPDDKMQVQLVGGIVEQTNEALNLSENLETLDKAQLLRLAALQFGEDWTTKRLGVEKLRARVKKRLAAEQTNESSAIS